MAAQGVVRPMKYRLGAWAAVLPAAVQTETVVMPLPTGADLGRLFECESIDVPALQHRRGVESRRTAADDHDALAFGGIQTPDDGGVPQRRVDEPDAISGVTRPSGNSFIAARSRATRGSTSTVAATPPRANRTSETTGHPASHRRRRRPGRHRLSTRRPPMARSPSRRRASHGTCDRTPSAVRACEASVMARCV